MVRFVKMIGLLAMTVALLGCSGATVEPLVHIGSPPGYQLVSHDSISLPLKPGLHTFVFEKEGIQYAVTADLQGSGGEVYAFFLEKDLAPVVQLPESR